MPFPLFKVGELARRTGVSVRTLHHYDEIGLLPAAGRSPSGHRLYGRMEIERLLHIRSLQRLGFSLNEIQVFLERPGRSVSQSLAALVHKLDARIEEQIRLRDRLAAVAQQLASKEEISVDALITTIQEFEMFEKYYTPEQLEQLAARREQLGDEGLRQSEQDWQVLMAEVRQAMQDGADPESERVQALARRWNDLIEAFTGGDPGIRASLGRLWAEQGDQLTEQHQVDADPAMFDFIGQALARRRRNSS